MIEIQLYEWALGYVKNKDLIVRNIVSITDGAGYFLVEYKNKKTVYLIEQDISDINGVLNKLRKFSDCRPIIVSLNTKKNFNTLLDNWKTFVGFDRYLCLIFANPDSEIEKKWIVFPHTHSKITDASSLKPGLESMANTVDKVK